jgi:hypothetical protein
MPDRSLQIDTYLDGDLNEQESESLRAWIAADPSHAKHFARRVVMHQQIRATLHRERIEALHKPERFLQDLIEMERKAPVLTRDEETPGEIASRPRLGQKRIDTLRSADAAAIAGYILSKAAKSKPAMIAAAAAILLLASVVFLFWGSDSKPQVAQQNTSNATPDVSIDPFASDAVAMITAEHDAQWSTPGGNTAPVVGEVLTAGQRLTLSQGFAEITTRRGAVAVLEAPATIELLDNDNAVRLHAGKLVGICETPMSKGFIVRTPHMDITDLGTRFGVDLSDTRRTSVHVLEGEVQARPTKSEANTAATRLSAGQSAIASVDQPSVKTTAYQPDRFAGIMKNVYQPPDYVLAYWRFEEGTPGSKVPNTGAQQKDFSQHAFGDASGNGNLLYAYAEVTSPLYGDSVPQTMIPQTRQVNRGVLDDRKESGKQRYQVNVFTRSSASKPSRPVDQTQLAQWTIEISVKPVSLEGKQTYICKYDRTPESGTLLSLGIDEGRPFVMVDDGSGTIRKADSNKLISKSEWIHIAAICDGQTLWLYDKTDQDDRYQLVAKTTVERAMSTVPAKHPDGWAWSIGSAQGDEDAYALIDEVRISNKALTTDQLLFSKPNE